MTRAFGSLVLCAVVAVIMSFATPTQTFATTDYWWDSYGSTTATAYSASGGGPGVWNSTGTLWRVNTSAGKVATKGVISNWVDGNNAIFASTAGTVTLGQAINANGLIFRTNGYVIGSSTFTLTLSGNAWVDAESGVTATINNVIGGSVGLNMTAGINTGNPGNTALTNAGTVVLTQGNTYTGTTTLGAGTLKLDFTAAGAAGTDILYNGQSSGRNLSLSGGCLAAATNAGTQSQTLDSVALATETNSSIDFSASASGSSLALGSISRGQGAFINFKTGSGNITTSNSNGYTTVLAPYATVSGNTWAANDGSGNVIGLADGSYGTSFTSGTDFEGAGSQSVTGGGATINSLRFNTAGASAMTIGGSDLLTITSGGILMSTAAGAVNIGNGGGTLTGNSSGELAVIQNNASSALTIDAAIVNNGGPLQLTKTGAGNLILTNAANNFTGGALVVQGTLTNNSGALVDLASGTVLGTLAGTSGYSKVTAGTVTFGNAATIAAFQLGDGTTTPTIGGATLALSSGNFDVRSGTFNDVLNGSGIGLVKSTAGTVTLAVANTYTGDTTVTAGTLSPATSTSLGTGRLILDGGRLQLNATALTVGGFILNGGFYDSNGGSGRTLTSNGGYDLRSGTMGNGGGAGNINLAGSGGLLKTTSGTVTYTVGGTATYTGTATIEEGLIYDKGGAAIANGTLYLGDLATQNNNYYAAFITDANTVNSNNIVVQNFATNGSGDGKSWGYEIGSDYTGGSPKLSGAITLDQPLVISGNSTAGNADGLQYYLHLGTAGSSAIKSGGGAQTVTFYTYSTDTRARFFGPDGTIDDGSGTMAVNVNGTFNTVFLLTPGTALSNYSGGTVINGGSAELMINDDPAGASHPLGTGSVRLGGPLSVSTVGVGLFLDNSVTDTTEARNINIVAGTNAQYYAIGTNQQGNHGATYSGTIYMGQDLQVGKYAVGGGGGNQLHPVALTGVITPVGADATVTRTINFGVNDVATGAPWITVSGQLIDNATSGARLALALPTHILGGVQNTNGNISVLMTGTSNNYSGPTTISTGTLECGATNTLSPNSSVIINNTHGNLFLAAQLLGGSKTGYNQSVAGFSMTGGTIDDNGTGAILTSASTYDMQAGTVNAVLNGNVGLMKTTGGFVTLNRVNTYTGATTVSGGSLNLGVDGALPTTTALIMTQGALNDAAFNPTVGSLSLQGGTISSTGNTGTLTVTGDINVQSATTLFLSSVTGTNLTKTANTSYTLDAPISYTGTTTVSAGTLVLGNATAMPVTTGLTVAGGTLDIGAFAVNVGATHLGDGTPAGGGSIIGAGVLTSATTFDVRSGSAAAILDGAGIGLNKTTSGVVTLFGINTYTGPTSVTAGTLNVALGGSLAAGSSVSVTGAGARLDVDGIVNGSVNVTAGGTIGGNGTIGGALSISGGVLSPGHSPGTLQVNGVTLDASSTYAVELASTSSYDNTIVLSGNAALNGASLQLTELGGYVFTPGDQFWIIDSNAGGTSAVDGQFAQGSTITLGNGDVFTIAYNVGGDPLGSGFDALLTASQSGSTIPEPGTMLLLGTGALGVFGWLRRRTMR